MVNKTNKKFHSQEQPPQKKETKMIQQVKILNSESLSTLIPHLTRLEHEFKDYWLGALDQF